MRENGYWFPTDPDRNCEPKQSATLQELGVLRRTPWWDTQRIDDYHTYALASVWEFNQGVIKMGIRLQRTFCSTEFTHPAVGVLGLHPCPQVCTDSHESSKWDWARMSWESSVEFWESSVECWGSSEAFWESSVDFSES